jgi:hypothetical protein
VTLSSLALRAGEDRETLEAGKRIARRSLKGADAPREAAAPKRSRSRSAKGLLIVASATLLLTAGPVAAASPTAAEIAACNKEAKTEAGTASASPGTAPGVPGQPREVPDARGGVLTGAPLGPDAARPDGPGARRSSDPTGRTITGSEDPQLEGVDAEASQDPVYLAAYKRCMRQRGF